MSEQEWTALRVELCKQFDEDVVQQTLLELLEELAKGVVVLNPLHWCRMRARQVRSRQDYRARLDRESRETLQALRLQCNPSSQREETAERKRRQRRKAA